MFLVNNLKENICVMTIQEPREKRDEENFFATLNNLLKKSNFGIVLEVTGEKAFSLEAKKELNLWFRTNKNDLSQKCFGFVRVNQDLEELNPNRIITMKRAMPCDYEVKATIEEATTYLRNTRLA